MVLKCVNMCLDRGLSLEMIPHLWFQAENETNMTCVCLCVVSVYLCNRCRTGCISIELRFIDLYENNCDMHVFAHLLVNFCFNASVILMFFRKNSHTDTVTSEYTSAVVWRLWFADSYSGAHCAPTTWKQRPN